MNALTVVIPVYNGEKYIERAAMSVLRQPCAEHLELLLVDDGSCDHSGVICDRIAAEHTNVTVFHKENGGVSSARNLGIDHAQGAYLAFLDADDWREDNFFDETLLAEISCPESVDIFRFAWKQNNADCRYECYHLVQEQVIVRDDQVPGIHCDHAVDHHCAYFFRRMLLNDYNLRYLPVKIAEERTFIEFCLFCASSYRAINKVMFTYWENAESCIHTIDLITNFEEEYKAQLLKKA